MAKLKTSLDQLEGLKVKIDGGVSSWKLSFDERRDSALREVENRGVRIGELSKEKAALDGAGRKGSQVENSGSKDEGGASERKRGRQK